eukprot:765857-Hanusia_phi.AAC.7
MIELKSLLSVINTAFTSYPLYLAPPELCGVDLEGVGTDDVVEVAGGGDAGVHVLEVGDEPWVVLELEAVAEGDGEGLGAEEPGDLARGLVRYVFQHPGCLQDLLHGDQGQVLVVVGYPAIRQRDEVVEERLGFARLRLQVVCLVIGLVVGGLCHDGGAEVFTHEGGEAPDEVLDEPVRPADGPAEEYDDLHGGGERLAVVDDAFSVHDMEGSLGIGVVLVLVVLLVLARGARAVC